MDFRSVAAAFLVITTALASVSERYAPEDDEDMSIYGSFKLTFRVSVNCNESWYSDNVILFTDQLHNSIIEGIREDCEGCGFQEKHLKEEIISCQPREHSVYYRAKIYNWESLYYPVPVILGRIRARYGNNTNTLIMPTIDFSNGSFDSEDDLELIATNVSTNYTIIRSEISSGEGEVTTKEDTLMTLSTVTLSDAFGADARPRGLPMSALCSLAVGVLTLHKLLLH